MIDSAQMVSSLYSNTQKVNTEIGTLTDLKYAESRTGF